MDSRDAAGFRLRQRSGISALGHNRSHEPNPGVGTHVQHGASASRILWYSPHWYLFKDAPGDWTREKIQAAMNGTRTIRVNLTRPINVLILYATALATEAVPMLFFDDIYGFDKKLERPELGLAPVR